jgi:transcriptional regulator with XRE-family HTH domain
MPSAVAALRRVGSEVQIMTGQKHPMRMAREARHWSIDSLAERTGLSRRTLLRAEQGRGLNPSSRQLICKVFDMSAEDLGLTFRQAGGKLGDVASRCLEIDERDRREFIHLEKSTETYAQWRSTQRNWLSPQEVESTSVRYSILGIPKRVTLAHVEAARELTQTFRRQDNGFGGGYARGIATHYLDSTVIPLLRHGRYDEDVGQALFGTAAQLAHLVAWMAYDMQDHFGAKRYMRKALELTTAADDDAFGGEILAGMSHHAIHLRHGAEAIDLARGSQYIATKVHLSALLAEAHVMEAHGHALLSDSKSCAASLHAAEVAFDQSQLSDLPQWLHYLDEGYLAARFAHGFRDLRDWRQAEHFALRAARMSDTLARAHSFNTVLLATTYVENDLEQACRVGLEGIESASELQSGRTLQYVHDLARD